MSPSSRIPQYFVIFALVFHSAWIVNHLRWVATEQVNPWKLGGYGMYTVPPPTVRVQIHLKSPLGGPGTPLDPNTYKLDAFSRSVAETNADRVFRCAPVRAADIRAFFQENPQWRGVNLFIVFTERYLTRDPVEIQIREQGRVQVQWIGDSDLVYGSLFCGNMVTGEVSM